MNRLANLATEQDAADRLLEQLARAHASESRAADIVVDEVIRGRFRWSPALDWLVWDGRRWDIREGGTETVREVIRVFIDTSEKDLRVKMMEADKRAQDIATGVFARCGDDDLKDEKGKPKAAYAVVTEKGQGSEADEFTKAVTEAERCKRQADMWLNLLSKSKVTNIEGICRGMPGVLTLSTQLDQHPDLLNCLNGVVNLATGEVRPHDPDYLITKLAGGSYAPGTKSARFAKALQAVHPLALDWFQLRMGQTFTGHTPDDDSMVVSAGGGENGKSAVMLAMLRAAGDYGRTISHKVLITVPGQHSTELMDLRGLRFALLEETPEEGRLDTHQLKTTIGTPQITARLMRQNTITFDTTHSLWVNTNFMPQVDSTDHGTWRRLKAMPWPFKFLKEWETPTEAHHRPGDRTLKPALKTDPTVADAALTWVVEGAIRWYALHQVTPRDPAPVVEATAEWRKASDVAFQFASTFLAPADNHYITADAMFTALTDFLVAEGKSRWSKNLVNTRLPESLLAAGISVDRLPTQSTGIRAQDTMSSPTSQTRADAWAAPAPPVPLAVGKTARVWRGVRFRSLSEIGQPLTKAG